MNQVKTVDAIRDPGSQPSRKIIIIKLYVKSLARKAKLTKKVLFLKLAHKPNVRLPTTTTVQSGPARPSREYVPVGSYHMVTVTVSPLGSKSAHGSALTRFC